MYWNRRVNSMNIINGFGNIFYNYNYDEEYDEKSNCVYVENQALFLTYKHNIIML